MNLVKAFEEAKRRMLRAFLQFAYEQGICHRNVAPEEPFPRRVLASDKG
jgi:hypothetical protein